MKSYLNFPTRILLAAAVALALIAAAPARTAQAGVVRQDIGNDIAFSRLGFAEDTLTGPFDSSRVLFSTPADWALADGASVTLNYAVFLGGVGEAPSADVSNVLGGSLEVRFNDELIATVVLDQSGEQSRSITIPVAALLPTRDDGRHELNLFLDSGLNCDFDRQTSVVVRASSFFTLPHGLATLPTDLTLLPRPIFQDTFLPDSATIVVPDQPTAGELQSALAIAAGFGQMSAGRLLLTLATSSQLSEAALTANHLIFVGNASAFPVLTQVPLPAAPSGTGYAAPNANPDDGVIQMAISPWNAARAMLVVGGNDDATTVKAGQAVSTGIVRVTSQSNLALVSLIQPLVGAPTQATDRTLADMGFPTSTVRRLGISSFVYTFYIPPGQALQSDAYLDLYYSHSALLSYEQSGLVANVNGEPVGSVRFSDETASDGRARITLPSFSAHAGFNRLVIDANLLPRVACTDPRLGNLWVTVRGESLLHLPLGPAAAGANQLLDLAQYPEPFTVNATLATTAFVLARDDPAGWNIAARIAYGLGDAANAPLVEIAAAYADAISDELKQSRDLIFVGRASTLPVVAELGDALPAPFAPGSDVPTERGVRVIYHVPPDVSVGYLEILPSPWNAERTILTVLGNSPQGLQWAGDGLTVPALRGKLSGNFAIVTGTQVVTGDTRLGTSASSVAATAVPGGQFEALPGAAPLAQRPLWILPVLAVSVILMLVIVVLAAAASLRRRGTPF